ncbi:hypothetical protein DAEQUDRAFT_767816 [Daedalea quercina L-15889]|uniref:Uncharacterized protein n=1 Tax=Daedalea quercina L-15889 TaxID=1314783 RepID=A0A165NAF4_9APHY|nr:hypothetical protein DAEQUDRAFT_767816 [Daedalea quercina L-15889]
MPVKVNITRYMERYALRLCTIHEGHPTRVLLNDNWTINTNNISFPFPEGKRKNSRTPLRACGRMAMECMEEFISLHPKCRPGDRLIDKLKSQVQWKFFDRDKRDKNNEDPDKPPSKKDKETGKISDDFLQFDMEHEAVIDWIDNSFDRSERFAQELYISWMSNPDHAGQVNAATLEEWKARQEELSNEDDLDDGTTFVNGSVMGSEEATPPPPQLIALLDLDVADVADQSQLQDAELKEALYRDRNLYLPPGNALALGGTPPPGG